MTEEEKQQHKHFLQEAIRLAKENVSSGKGGPFGAIVVKDGQIIASATNHVLETNDPTMHAEINAIRQACKKLGHFELSDCIIYSSCEPCPMCLGAIYWTRPKAVFFGADHRMAGRHGFDDDFIYQEIFRPMDQRHIPTVCMQLDSAEEPFIEWDNKTDKIQY